MYPVMILGHVGKLIHLFLGYGVSFGDSQFLPDQGRCGIKSKGRTNFGHGGVARERRDRS